ncbi:Nucleotide-binding universal stress protein, UspA family, partial [Pilibacter termitis]
EVAFQKAVNVALRNEGKLVLAHVIDTRAFQTVASFDGTLAEQAQELAQQTLNDYKNQALEMGVSEVVTVVEYGSPKSVLARQIPVEQQVDLIMLGATGLNAIERLLVGSVSEYVIRHAPCDVLIVRTELDNVTGIGKK